MPLSRHKVCHPPHRGYILWRIRGRNIRSIHLTFSIVDHLSSYWFLSHSVKLELGAWTFHLDLHHSLFHYSLGGGIVNVAWPIYFVVWNKAVTCEAAHTLSRDNILKHLKEVLFGKKWKNMFYLFSRVF